MKYTEFLDKLRSVRADYLKARGREPETIKELEDFVASKVLKPRTRGLRSLKGISF